MNKLVIGSTNPGKIRDIFSTLSPPQEVNIQLLSLADFDIIDDPEETGKTFEENAKLKAKYYGKKTSLPTLADDGGLVIPALNGEPGVHSRRWIGRKANDQELIDYCLLRMKDIPEKDRTAYLEVYVTVYDPKKDTFIGTKESIKGRITTKVSQNVTKGYPYRALFIVDKYNKYYDELSAAQHKAINHRQLALVRLIPKIKKIYLV